PRLFIFSSRRRNTRWPRDWSSDVCSSDLPGKAAAASRRSRAVLRFAGRAGAGGDGGMRALAVAGGCCQDPRRSGAQAENRPARRSEERRVGEGGGWGGRGGWWGMKVVGGW